MSEGIAKLQSQLDSYAPNSVWTIAVFENPSFYAHFSPLRPSYKAVFEKYTLGDVMSRIVKREKLDHTYQEFYGCNIRLTEPYEESQTGERIRTIYYPIHNKQSLEALVAIDIKDSFIDLQVQKYNQKYETVLNVDGTDNIYHQRVRLPCSDGQYFGIGIHYVDILKKSIIPSLLIAFLVQLTRAFVRRHGHYIKHDEMTGFYRRDYYEPKLKRMQQFSMLIIDIDNFKQINDSFGHRKGDDVIRESASLIQKLIRSGDVAIRWGGEEFILLFNGMAQHDLQEKAESIRAAFSEQKTAGLAVTVSIGGVFQTDSTFGRCYKAADTALYESKHRGRNRVTIA
ncbi:GGDEF domain-containing protein [Enterovibrio sp. ZSDZ35]|uniref:diguanylate cyclase n=1 Tax=Enterovibrio qingdaonensis TaxID=2899818 RepID=A0ABT5QPB1_9GAMM|nr:GGDEF domain-containing protein [Enterovibrio sp. ZSDZ35]MDD1782815.1 GGDEF domain-containing protein [Enterovibrio sp. ZSDZ35]